MLCAKAARLCLPGLLLSLAATSSAQSLRIAEYLIPTPGSNPNCIAAGPDGGLWFTELAANKIGRIATAGVIAEYVIPTPKSGPYGITAGSDGAIWFVEYGGNNIGRISTAGAIAEYALPSPASGPMGITAGPDGALWFVEHDGNNIGRISTAGAITEYALPTPASGPLSITAGPDGAIWFLEYGGNKVGRITPGGVIAEYDLPAPLYRSNYITAGPDGALWFTQYGGLIGRITTAGVVTSYALNLSTSGASAGSLAAGPDGALWFTEYGGQGTSSHKIGRITPEGTVTEYTLPTSSAVPYVITLGPDGALWYTGPGGNRIGRATLVFPAPVIAAVTSGADGNIKTIQSNSWVTIWGSNLAPAGSGRAWGAQDIIDGRLPRSLDGVSVTFSGQPGFVQYVSPTQVNVLAPPGAAAGPASVVITNGSAASKPFSAQLQTYSPAFFTFAPPSQKYIAAICLQPDGSFDYLAPLGAFGSNASSRPAKPGQIVVLFGTGFGPTSPEPPPGQVFFAAYSAAAPVAVTIGGINANVAWAGLSAAGLNQLNVIVPVGLPNGDAPVVAKVGGVQSQGGMFIPVHQ
jgi:virginiamycin B lyase